MTNVDASRDRRRAQAVKYVGALDGIRALAAFGVVIIHTLSEAGASIGLYAATGAITGPLFMSFFIITGFVLYRGWGRRHLALHDRTTPGAVKARGTADGGSDGRAVQYLLRRLLRIYPLYWVVATAAMLVSDDSSSYTWGQRLQVYLLSPWPDLDALVGLGLGIIVWTLIVDVAFYVYVSIHGAVMTRVVRAFRRTSPFRVESTVLITMFGGLFAITPFVRAPIAALACLPLGMWFAVIEAEQDRLGRRLREVATIVRLWYVWLLTFVLLAPIVVISIVDKDDYDRFITDTWGVHVLLVLASVLLIVTVLWGRPSWPFNRLLASNEMKQAGKLTYGTYLWHPVVLMVLHRQLPDAGIPTYLLVTIVASTVLAVITYLLIEWPIANLRTTLRGEPKASA